MAMESRLEDQDRARGARRQSSVESSASGDHVDPITVHDLHVSYGTGSDRIDAIEGLTFSVQKGEFVCIVGPSGCGKSTLMKTLAGLMLPTSGSVLVGGKKVVEPPRELALVFQEYTRSLLPWLTVQRNVELPLKNLGMSRRDRHASAQKVLSDVGLRGFEMKYPWQLSGGMQQRVAIARALAYRPTVLLMDEPFASVDAQTRSDLEDLVLSVQRESGVTVLFVTHDIDEAVYLGDRVLVLAPRPTKVKWTTDVSLPHPRDQVATKADPVFVTLRSEVAKLIRHDSPTRSSGQ